jgi:hypothetical protein
MDRVLRLLRLFLIPLLIVGASVPTVAAVAGLGALSKGWALALAVLALVALYVALQRMQSVRDLVDSLFGRLQRQVVMACQTDAPNSQGGSGVGCLLTAEELRAPLLPYAEQRRAVRDLLAACRQDQMGQYWFLEGRSGRGKTRTGMLFVQELVRDLNLAKFGTHTYLYDFSGVDSEQDALLRSLGSTQHKQAVVLVDNFQLVREDVLSRLTNRLIDQPSSLTERMLLFLTRPPDAWNIGRGGEVRLVSEARVAKRHLELSGPPSEALARSLAQVDPEGSQLIRGLQKEAVASAPQLHLAQVIQRQGSTPVEIAILARLLKGDAPDSESFDLVEVLAVVAALSMHSGSFSERALRRAENALAGDPGAGGSVGAQRRRATLRRLRRIGLVTRSHQRGTLYQFHEASAKLCIDELSNHFSFEGPFGMVGRSRLQEVSSAGDPLKAWLIAVEVGAQGEAAMHFDAAMASGPYTRMLRCLERAKDRYDLSPALHLQMAILLDRTGDFEASQEAFSDEVLLTLDPSSELSLIFIATRLEASHDHTLLPAIDLLCNHPDRVVAIVGEYWKLHFAAHGGRFASPRLLALGVEALDLARSHESHWLDYSLGRIHFDSLRHFYLEGAMPVEAVVNPERRAIGEYLSPRLPSYDAFETLYTRAHLVGQVLLPQVGIFFEPVTPEQAALAEVELREVETKNGLVAVAQRLYRSAREQFRQYGDREAEYLQADVLFTDMIEEGVTLDDFGVGLHQYERFIKRTGIEDIASYPHLYFLRWHMLKYYEVLPQVNRLAPQQADDHLDAAHRRLQRVVELDSAAGNKYGLMRAEMLEILLRWVKGPPAEEELRSLAQQMSEHGYGWERRLLDHLADSGPLPFLELREVFRFYPFVGQ